MRRRTKTSKPSPGQSEQRLKLATRAKDGGGAGALILSAGLKHMAWAAQVAGRFGVRRAKRGFAKAQILDLAMREAVQRETKMATAGAFYDKRRWIRNEFKNIVLQQLFVARPVAAKHSDGGAMQELRRAGSQRSLQSNQTERTQLSPLFVKQFPHASAIVRRTAQVKGTELPLVLAGTRLMRRGGAGSAPPAEVEESGVFELPVAKLARRHQRREISRQRVTSESLSHNSMENLQQTTVECAQPIIRTQAQKRLPAVQQEAGEVGSATLRGMNVTQVADEVMKQLDRRLTAARERMGKI